MQHEVAPLNVSPHAMTAAAVVTNDLANAKASVKEPQALKECVEQTMEQYFVQLEGQPVTNVYEMVLSEVEAPLLQVVMRVCGGNQCRAADMMGLSRGTLRKKLQQHGML